MKYELPEDAGQPLTWLNVLDIALTGIAHGALVGILIEVLLTPIQKLQNLIQDFVGIIGIRGKKCYSKLRPLPQGIVSNLSYRNIKFIMYTGN